jgi:cell division protein FtsB
VTHWDSPAELKSRRSVVLVVLLLVALAVTMGGIFPFRQIIAQRAQVDDTRARYEQLVEQNVALDERIAALQTDAGVEQLAREQFGFVRPGEEPFEIDGPLTIESQPETHADVVLDDRGLFERFWDFLTGRDVGTSGDG